MRKEIIGTATLYLGDCLEVMKSLPENSVDAIVTDPPYGLAFMGKKWDYDVPSVAAWVQALRVLKPGGHLLAFGGSRTYHRMVVNIEDAGFEVRDQIMWLYGSGFPKSLNISKAIDKAAGVEREVVGKRTGRAATPKHDIRAGNFIGSKKTIDLSDIKAPATPEAKEWEGWGTALKPAHEPIVVARKPLIGTVVENVLAHRTGGINVDGCKVGVGDDRSSGGLAKSKTVFRLGAQNARPAGGRWPANVMHDGSDEVRAEFTKYSEKKTGGLTGQPRAENKIYGSASKTLGNPLFHKGDTGSAARFFYTAKTSPAERNEGLGGCPLGPAPGSKRSKPAEGRSDALGKLRANHHPTVKPVALMRYLVRLVTPPGGVVLDNFMGSGSTGVAAWEEGFDFIGIEKPDEQVGEEHFDIACQRIRHAQKQMRLFDSPAAEGFDAI